MSATEDEATNIINAVEIEVSEGVVDIALDILRKYRYMKRYNATGR